MMKMAQHHHTSVGGRITKIETLWVWLLLLQLPVWFSLQRRAEEIWKRHNENHSISKDHYYNGLHTNDDEKPITRLQQQSSTRDDAHSNKNLHKTINNNNNNNNNKPTPPQQQKVRQVLPSRKDDLNGKEKKTIHNNKIAKDDVPSSSTKTTATFNTSSKSVATTTGTNNNTSRNQDNNNSIIQKDIKKKASTGGKENAAVSRASDKDMLAKDAATAAAKEDGFPKIITPQKDDNNLLPVQKEKQATTNNNNVESSLASAKDMLRKEKGSAAKPSKDLASHPKEKQQQPPAPGVTKGATAAAAAAKQTKNNPSAPAGADTKKEEKKKKELVSTPEQSLKAAAASDTPQKKNNNSNPSKKKKETGTTPNQSLTAAAASDTQKKTNNNNNSNQSTPGGAHKNESKEKKKKTELVTTHNSQSPKAAASPTAKDKKSSDVATTTAAAPTTNLAQQKKNELLRIDKVKERQQKKGNKKPKLYIHIGPSKTGTSTIQRESSYWPKPLEKDNYYYLGKFGDAKYRAPAKIPILLDEDDCFKLATSEYRANKTKAFRETPCWSAKIAGLDHHRVQGHNIILSDEAYSYKSFLTKKSHDFWSHLHIALEGWNVIVVPTYRRYHEWYLSGIKERNRKQCLRSSTKAGKWPHLGGSPCHNLWNPMYRMIHHPSSKKDDDNNNPEHYWPGTNSYMNLDESIPYWKDIGGFTIQMLNFHSTEHLTCAFYCDLIKDTPSMCHYCRAQQGTNQNPSPAALTAYDDVVFEAAKRGMVEGWRLKDQSRSQAVSSLARTTSAGPSGGLNDLPLICPPHEELEALLNRSLAFEEYIMPELYRTPRGEKIHREEFWKLANDEKTFCWVDKDALLEGKKSYQEVLDALKQKQKQRTTNSTQQQLWPIQYQKISKK